MIPVATCEEPERLLAELVEETGRAIGAPAVLHRASDYRTLVSALEQGAVEIAWIPPLIAAAPVARGRITPLALAVRNGATTYWAALITHLDSAVRTAADLRGARAAWVDRESASGYVVIRRALRARGIHLTEAFGEETFARSHAEVARLVIARRVDVGATYLNDPPASSRILRGGWIQRDGVPPDDVRIVADAGPIPSDFFAARTDLPLAVREAFQAAIVDGLPEAPRRLAKIVVRADGFVRPTAAHAAMLEELLRTLDLPRPAG